MSKTRRNGPELSTKMKHLVDNGLLSIQYMPRRGYRSVLEKKGGRQLGSGLGATIGSSINDLYDDVFGD